ncbi:YozQ family protein [Niallia circulans]|uniref:YozQ family protein n=1 Tax=Niallia circulans TaxID=1397 RepID=UPI00148FC66F|nr:YozQ family protein [Niallia circulans]QJX61637.1 YozQ family protein [Niallia circulans]
MNKDSNTNPAGKTHQPDEKKQKDEASKGLKETHDQANDSLTEGTIDKKKKQRITILNFKKMEKTRNRFLHLLYVTK